MVKELEIQIRKFGERAVLIEWPKLISTENLQAISQLHQLIADQYGEIVIDLVPAYHSLTVYPDLRQTDLDSFIEYVSSLELELSSRPLSSTKTWQVPVCYDIGFGTDLEEMSVELGLSVEEIIRLHTEPEYLVHFIGFLPGFLYLGGLNERLHMARRSVPRSKVAKGSVAIGGEQTGVYPVDSPAGWQVIGRSPIDFFDVSLSSPCFAKAGDRVKFVSIDLKSFVQLEKEVKSGNYQLGYE